MNGCHAKFIIFLSSIEIIGFLGFIFASRNYDLEFAKYLPLVLALLFVVIVAYFIGKTFSYREILIVSVVISLLFIMADQILSVAVFPGLSKGIDFISADNLIRSIVIVLIGTAGHFLLLLLVRFARMNK